METTDEGWRSRVTYPQCVAPRAARLLDMLSELVPVPDTGDRAVDVADWLRDGEAKGLLTGREVLDLRFSIAPNL
jgi:hypothetical protein